MCLLITCLYAIHASSRRFILILQRCNHLVWTFIGWTCNVSIGPPFISYPTPNQDHWSFEIWICCGYFIVIRKWIWSFGNFFDFEIILCAIFTVSRVGVSCLFLFAFSKMWKLVWSHQRMTFNQMNEPSSRRVC